MKGSKWKQTSHSGVGGDVDEGRLAFVQSKGRDAFIIYYYELKSDKGEGSLLNAYGPMLQFEYLLLYNIITVFLSQKGYHFPLNKGPFFWWGLGLEKSCGRGGNIYIM